MRFVSTLMNFHFVPSEIRLSRLSDADVVKAIKDCTTYPGDHDVYYLRSGETPGRSLWVGHSFAHARNDRELAALVKALTVWIERNAKWRNATILMTHAFSLERTMSAERLLTACKWLEEIPGASSAAVLSEPDIDRIASVAAAEAKRLGHNSDCQQRIASVRALANMRYPPTLCLIS